LALAHLVGALEPAKVARAVRIVGDKEAREIGIYLRLLLLGLRQYGRRSQKSDGHGRKKDLSRHWVFLPGYKCVRSCTDGVTDVTLLVGACATPFEGME
jgi:hypothetical protein